MKDRKKRNKKKRREKKAHQYLDAMRPAKRINVPFKRNRKGSTQLRKGKDDFKRKENVERKEAINTWTSLR